MTRIAFALRPVSLAHIAVLAELHASGPDEPWSADAFARLLVLPGTFGHLAVSLSEEVPVGFVLARAAADEAEILAINVLPHWRRRGVGRALLGAVMSGVRDGKRLLLEVAEGNAPALALYRGCGFHPVGRRTGYYARAAGRREDALSLAVELEATASTMDVAQSTVNPPKG
jgi:ribosomal-protein-alanine N-acetyltransferase